MAFGKVTVHTESGEVEEYELTRPTTSVGRQPGNDIVLNSASVSRYHAQFDVSEGRVYLVDLGTVNGTFINDQQVEPNSRVVLNDGDVITLGDVMLVFSSPEARPRTAVSLAPTTTAVEKPGHPFRLILDIPQQAVAPGARLQLVLVVENLTADEQLYTVEVGGPQREWVTVNRREMLLMPYEQSEATISVRPPRSAHTLPGRYPLTVRVALKDDAASALEAVREIDVVGYTGLGMVVRPERTNGFYQVAVQNQGNVPLEVALQGFDRQRQLSYHFEASQVRLAPGETQQVRLQVRPRSGSKGVRRVRFAVIARSLDSAGYLAPVEAEYVSPARTSWLAWAAGLAVPLAIVGLLALIAAVAALVYLDVLPLPRPIAAQATPTTEAALLSPLPGPTPSLIPTPSAAIHDFAATPEEVLYNTRREVLFTWRVSGATDIHLTDEQGVALPLSAADKSTGRHRLPVPGLERGEHAFTLTVIGADGQPVSRSVVIKVISVLCTVDDFQMATVYSEPNPAAPPAPPLLDSRVLINGRSEDALWVQVTYNDLETFSQVGWLPADRVKCSSGDPPITDYEVLAFSTTPPPVTPSLPPADLTPIATPTPETP